MWKSSLTAKTRKGLLRQSAIDSVPVYFIENREFFDRDGMYGTAGGDYPDNAQRFGFFCRATLEFLRRLDFRPDVLHLNDWQTGLIPVLLRSELKNDPFYNGIATLLTIHNLGYQGLFPAEALSVLQLDPALFSVKGMEFFGKISFLKGGLLFADMINTVSPTYCREIQTPELGLRLRRHSAPPAGPSVRHSQRHRSQAVGSGPEQCPARLSTRPPSSRGKASTNALCKRNSVSTSMPPPPSSAW